MTGSWWIDVEEGGEALDRMQLPRQGGSEVEAEAVDVHLVRPSSAGCP